MPPALKTDQHPITFSDRNDFDAAQLIHLYRQSPWAKHRALEQAQAMLAKTDVVISAWDGPRLVGFGRVLTDYVFRASIWDVIVDRDYQGRKIGTEIVRRILDHPTLQQVELFWLCTRMPGFYERLGFSAKEQTGMVWSRKKADPPPQ
ncbi:N-acetyltransferase, GCN5-related [Nitrospira defluvii]|jgi:ribosomal protein S18 acetylase RimI-like enzyme|uniref:N-acetyltransferase, GCN5-related n=1 Tax=Nitrospira defluvii TaxID=330214 RepID=D8PAA1_9BACT|nr:N-acetyltransferase, GCN5-related [Nitrospira defluvii]